VFRIKICGVRLKKDIDAVEQSGGDAIGLNFFPPSVRYLDPALRETRELSESARRRGLLRVGVFVNESVERMLEVADAVGLDAVQLHGDESLRTAGELVGRERRVIRAVKLPRTAIAPDTLDERIRPWRELGCHPLLDADAGAAHGGSGKTLHWPSLREWAESRDVGEWTLAGGLRPENIAAAIAATGAVSVDTASGVECPRGSKHPGRVADFITASGLGRSTP
jgi:phosphoribosylanthranilate isomerase